MAFRIGQRVKRIGGCAGAAYEMVAAGAEGVVTGSHNNSVGELLYDVDWDTGIRWNAVPESLSPLIDPKADAFVERMKNLKPYEEPTVQKVRA